MIFLVKIGFFNITLWDILDIAIVGYLLFFIYRWLRGSIAFNIFLGILAVYATWGIVNVLGMVLLSGILNEVIKVGMIAIFIIFQPELRRILLLLGRILVRQRRGFISQIFSKSWGTNEEKKNNISEIKKSILHFKKTKTGALLVFSGSSTLHNFANSGVQLHAQISRQLLISLFHKDSPLHDGAVFIADAQVWSASCILPVSQNPTLPQKLGLRHRSAVGATEGTDLVCIVVSEENGKISYTRDGEIIIDLKVAQLDALLERLFKEFYPEEEG